MDIDIFQLPGIVRKRIHYVILAALACVIFGMVFVLTQKPFFRSTAELFIDMGGGRWSAPTPAAERTLSR